ncbi:MAG: hypothetical protein RO009_16075 [Pseudorhodoplanes sp.]|nr:hypothetical protein [Pseudorhodoplanes sp.]
MAHVLPAGGPAFFQQALRKTEVLTATRKIDELVEVLGNDLELVVVVEGDQAAVIRDGKLRQRSTGRVMRYKVAAFHRYRNAGWSNTWPLPTVST